MYVCLQICMFHVLGAQMKLHVVVSHHVGAENQIQAPCKNASVLNC